PGHQGSARAAQAIRGRYDSAAVMSFCIRRGAAPGLHISAARGERSMTVAEATPDLEQGEHDDRAFLGHPKGLGYLGFTEACERFSYYSMQTLLALYMVNYLLVPARMSGVLGLDWLGRWHYPGLQGQPLASAIFGDYTSLVYLT